MLPPSCPVTACPKRVHMRRRLAGGADSGAPDARHTLRPPGARPQPAGHAVQPGGLRACFGAGGSGALPRSPCFQ